MDEKAYLSNQDVVNFVEWLQCHLPTMRFDLNITHSRFVHGGLKRSINGVDELLGCYRWGADWNNTKHKINGFRQELKAHLGSKTPDQYQLLQVCLNVVDWGGDRNPNRGAKPFLISKADDKTSLSDYLQKCKDAFKLSLADTEDLGAVELMNSMLTKIHAFVASDGLPIYDSRVAAAIAALVELYRRQTNTQWGVLPEELKFPALSPSRTIAELVPDADVHSHGFMNYDVKLWAATKIRLGWLLKAVLESNESILEEEGDLPSRMHALEACLFMIGYNVHCLSANLPDNNDGKLAPEQMHLQPDTPDQDVHNEEALRQNSRITWDNAVGINEIRFTKTLGKGNEVKYLLIENDGVLIAYNGGNFLYIDMEKIELILEDFSGKIIKLGASQTQGYDSHEISLGNRLIKPGHEIAKSRRHASHLAAILCKEFGVTNENPPQGGAGVFLKFPNYNA